MDHELTELIPVTVHEELEESPVIKVEATLPLSNKRASRPRKGKVTKVKSTIDKVIVKPNETKKEAVRRVKNNMASRVFRHKRRSNLEKLLSREEELVRRNRDMRKDVEMVEEMVQLLKEGLVNSAKSIRGE